MYSRTFRVLKLLFNFSIAESIIEKGSPRTSAGLGAYKLKVLEIVNPKRNSLSPQLLVV